MVCNIIIPVGGRRGYIRSKIYQAALGRREYVAFVLRNNYEFNFC